MSSEIDENSFVGFVSYFGLMKWLLVALGSDFGLMFFLVGFKLGLGITVIEFTTSGWV